MTVPNFFIIGAHKAGTTSLYNYLRAHPQVFMPDDKEPVHLTRPDFEDPAVRREYLALFDAAGDAPAIGEACTRKAWFPLFVGAPERIARLAPQARIIYLLRDPMERMRSQYVDAVASGREPRDMTAALLFGAGYGYPSRYALQIDQYLRVLDREQILLVTSDDLRNDRASTLTTVYRFLGVSADVGEPADMRQEHNRGDVKRMPRPTLRRARTFAARRGWNGRPVRLLAALEHAGSPWATTGIPAERRTVPAELRGRVAEMLRPDMERLAEWMPAGFDAWGILGGR
jgi:hypothetical protein